jgi:DNA invertase Pin-like site-specific DNA recombinase
MPTSVKWRTFMRVALYVRVSTDEQTVDNQRRDLEAVAAQRGWEIVETFDDNGVSGAKGREYRKQFDRLLKDATRGRFDMVAAWSVDRLGRSMRDLIGFLDELRAAKVDLYLHRQAVDTSTPAGRALFQMLGVFAEFERSLIQERVKAGMTRAKAAGKHLGRPRLPADVAAQVRALRASGMTYRAIAKKASCSEATARRLSANP